ncbi:NTP transferase domain-containing protein [Adhaeribacter pallidiroseus]|uniref:Molybdenum cofactor guanylyltransferase n=1 Tax=Adhaeribacter pallidiroseus TaxID=2072847 RepID=A0A369QE65_9BACT|nr:NTP transferase domain-containing protein [Adhaeribacter pallidiroseus]RDC61496.1 Molybdenum cofactor guanylyltransferase [Adhaeribacter pallidiroseus]
MTTLANKPAHQKHVALSRPALGHFGRTELAILGTPCGNIKKLAFALTEKLAKNLKIAYVDADHKSADAAASNGPDINTALAYGSFLEYTDKITFQRLDYRTNWNEYQQKAFFQATDLILVNGNHFPAQAQIIVIDPAKPLDKKLDKLTNVQLILLQTGVTEVPEFIQTHLASAASVPVYAISETEKITDFVVSFYQQHVPPLNGLVLAGGKSTRMQSDKGLLQYYDQDQRTHVHQLLSAVCVEAFVSCNATQAADLEGKLPYLEDRFLNFGPKGGILTALQHNPNAAWLAVACDLPFLSKETLAYLIQHRDPTKMATAFYDSDDTFPEPLLTIWEPRAFAVLLQFLSLGYSCPRKALINSDVKLLTIPDAGELRNVNDPQAYKEAITELQQN